MKPVQKRLIIFLAAVIFVFTAVFCLPKGFWGEKILFEVRKGENSRDIAMNLQSNGIIWWGPLFRLYVLTRGISGDLQAGIYRLSPKMSLFYIAESLAAGKIASQTLTIPEGFTAKQILQRIQSLQISGLEVANLADLQKQEGYLFPDTYQIPYNMPLDKIIKMMTDNFEKKTTSYQEAIKKSGHSLEQIVVMASLIEKEVQTTQDKAIVSGIFWKRIKNGMKLESCATIAYIKGVSQWIYSLEDTHIDSPYNTYLYYGLPQGPISNPGIESIKAAVSPKESSYWYWLSTPQGETIFSKTYQEHLAAKEKYLK
jgi:UPF0755 protein